MSPRTVTLVMAAVIYMQIDVMTPQPMALVQCALNGGYWESSPPDNAVLGVCGELNWVVGR